MSVHNSMVIHPEVVEIFHPCPKSWTERWMNQEMEGSSATAVLKATILYFNCRFYLNLFDNMLKLGFLFLQLHVISTECTIKYSHPLD